MAIDRLIFSCCWKLGKDAEEMSIRESERTWSLPVTELGRPYRVYYVMDETDYVLTAMGPAPM